VIHFDGIIFSARSRVGGVSVYIRHLFRSAIEHFPHVSMLVYEPDFRMEETGNKHGQVVYRRPRRLERFRTLRGLPKGLLHSSYYRWSNEPGVRNVVTVYDFTYERYLKGVGAVVHQVQKRRAIAKADAVLCISENTQRDLFKFIPQCDPSKVYVTHLAAARDFMPVEQVDTGDRPYVLFVGSRVSYKNFDIAVQAVARTREVELLVVGAEAFTAQERELLNRLLPGRHRYLGKVSTVELNQLYNRAVCLLYPSSYEGFGIPPLEAMQAGCPFIALNRSSIPEVAGPAGILLDAAEPELVAAAIEQCASPMPREELRRRGLKQARKFSWDRTFADTASVYRALGA
jgi:mannosyltransferase